MESNGTIAKFNLCIEQLFGTTEGTLGFDIDSLIK